MLTKRPSYAAIKKAEIEIIISLLKEKIEVKEISESGMTYLQRLSRQGRLKMIKILED